MSKKTKAKSDEPKKPRATVTKTVRQVSWLPKFSLYFFDRPRFTAFLFVIIFLFGIVSYTTLLKREGFPSINFPVASINGAYFAGDPAVVDQEVAKPISEAALAQEGVSAVSAQSTDNFFNIFIQYEEDIDAQAAAQELEQTIVNENIVPEAAQLTVSAPFFSAIGPTTQQVDIGISFYAESEAETAAIDVRAQEYAADLLAKNLSLVKDVFVISPFETALNQQTGEAEIVQRSFDRFGERAEVDGQKQNVFYNSVLIGVSQTDGADLLDFDAEVRQAVEELNQEEKYQDYTGFVSASFAPDIQDNISELQRELIIALFAVLIVGSLVIAVRASFITVISLILVILAVIGMLYVFGYSLNVITLFALILSLALIVDDTIIMIEAIDAQRRRQKQARKAVEEATHKITRAMLSATTTAMLSFAPLLFVGGILGGFIRAIPVTVISALFISLIISLIFLPFLARYILLRPKDMGEDGVKEIAAGIEHSIAKFISRPMLWAKHSTKRLMAVGLTAVFIGFAFIGAGGFIAGKLTFNIFPQSKDANDISVALTFKPGTDLAQAESITDKANQIMGQSLGENFEYSSLYNTGNERGASNSVKLISYKDRGPRSPQIIEQLQADFNEQLPEANVKVSQVDAGPPPQPFNVAVVTDDTEKGYALANDIASTLQSSQITRPSGEEVVITAVIVSNPSQITRVDNKQRITVTAEYQDTDTTTLFTLTEDKLTEIYTPDKIAEFGLDEEVLVFDLGQESENQESFATLALAFPILLAVIYVLLALQFRSLLQPLLIFMAIPFSFFGISLSLYLTDNPLSFFAMLGFFALIGLSIKNTILLTDYANQAKKAGMGSVDSIVEALGERFRPLVATSLTAIAAIVPLSIISPFWQGLAVLIIFGLLSSTILVITVFPYYYLGAEFLRQKINRKKGLLITLVILALLFGLPNIIG